MATDAAQSIASNGKLAVLMHYLLSFCQVPSNASALAKPHSREYFRRGPCYKTILRLPVAVTPCQVPIKILMRAASGST